MHYNCNLCLVCQQNSAGHNSSGLGISKWSEFVVGVKCGGMFVMAIGKYDWFEFVISEVIFSIINLVEMFWYIL